MVLLDLTLHPWDLARATGQPFDPSPAAVKELHGMVDMMAEQARAMKVFGPPVEPPAGGRRVRAVAGEGRTRSYVDNGSK
jgi:hypothetical protein